MMETIESKVASKGFDLKSKLGLLIFHVAASGFMTGGVIHQMIQGEYKNAAIIATLDIASALGAYVYGKSILENYDK